MSRGARIWRGVCIGAGVLFALFGLVQLNDPDPIAWVFVYGITAVYAFLGASGRLTWPAPAVWAGLAFFFGLRTWFTWDGSSNPMGDASQGLFAEEVVREAGGLFLVAGWCGAMATVIYWTPDSDAAAEAPGADAERGRRGE